MVAEMAAATMAGETTATTSGNPEQKRGQTAPHHSKDRNLEGHMTTKNLVRALILSLALLPSVSMADQGQLRSQMTYGDWLSSIFHINNTDFIRLTTTAASSRNSFLVLDFDSSGYKAQLISEKQGNQIGTVFWPNQIELNCELRVDTNPVFYISCFLYDDNAASYLVFGQSLGSRFIDEMKSGNTLRVKISNGQQANYDRYSLRGFTRSYRRGMSLMYGNGGYYGGGNDSDYFR